MSLPVPPSITFTASLDVITSLPEPVATFSMLHNVSLPLWLLAALPRPPRPLPRSTVRFAVIAA